MQPACPERLSHALAGKYHLNCKEKLGIRAKGRRVLENAGGFQLREKMGAHIANSASKNDDMGAGPIIGILMINFQ